MTPIFVFLCALMIRFPIPLGGYASGWDAIVPSLYALVFYGALCGGFIIQALLGGTGGLLAKFFADPDKNGIEKLCFTFSSIGSLSGVLTLVFLDKIIGPW